MRFRELFYIHKSDRQIILLLLTVAVVAILVISFIGSPPQQSAMITAADSARVETDTDGGQIPRRYAYSERQHAPIVYQQTDTRRAERFAFDPNTADSNALLRLGLEPWQVKYIYRYRARGGVYRKKSDFARLYGLTAKQYRELEPYIQISSDYLPATTLLTEDSASQPVAVSHKLSEGETIDLNRADTTALMTVPGIGSYLARRIVDYGQRLGGYVSIDQLDEIPGVPSTAKSFFVVALTAPRQINVNRLSLNELKRHPYINYYQARAIVDHRRNTGPIKDLSELHLLNDFPPEAIDRLRPYVSY